uniref:dUTPase n=1 Tax=Syphacia muris TaxID=451379 RepID=A0A0N5AIE3_9BILA
MKPLSDERKQSRMVTIEALISFDNDYEGLEKLSDYDAILNLKGMALAVKIWWNSTRKYQSMESTIWTDGLVHASDLDNMTQEEACLQLVVFQCDLVKFCNIIVENYEFEEEDYNAILEQFSQLMVERRKTELEGKGILWEDVQ